MKNKIQKINKKDSQLVNLESQLDLLLKGQEKNSDKLQIIGEELRRGFIGLALLNEELLKSNDQLKQQLDEVLKELNAIKQEREEKAARKEARANRKRLPKRDPMTRDIYKELIDQFNRVLKSQNAGPDAVAAMSIVESELQNPEEVDFKKLNKDILDLLVTKYPDGYDDDHIITFKNTLNEIVECVEVRTDNTIYLVKVSKRLVAAMEDHDLEEDEIINEDDENELPIDGINDEEE